MNASLGKGRTVQKLSVLAGCSLCMRVVGKLGDDKDENVILEPDKQSIFSIDVVCASEDIPVAPLHSCAILVTCVQDSFE